jgi:hypothetical protein
MGFRETRELARIRQELRDRLMACRHDGAEGWLERLRTAADDLSHTAPELRGEYERWRVRFDLLAP